MVSRRWLVIFGISLLAFFLLSACSDELARVHIQSAGEFEITFEHYGGPLAFWTDFDIEYQDARPKANYLITVYQDGEEAVEVVCNPFDTSYTRMMRKVEVRGITKESYLGQMSCAADFPEGELTVSVLFQVEGQVTIFRADLVLKRRKLMMSAYKKRIRNMYTPGSDGFAISRSKIDMFVECPRCFYLDRRLGLGRPSMPGWSLNSAVDELLKKEFDIYREKQEPHPLMVEYGIEAIPYQHPDLPIWRDDVYRYIGASVYDEETGLEIRGIVDDIWVNPAGELLIVDYKSTSTKSEISLEDEYKQGYKRQMEIYQWIFRKLGYKVASIGYFVFANGVKENEMFNARLEFAMTILAHEGDDAWVGETVRAIKQVLESDTLPESGEECEYCAYRNLISGVEEF